MSSHFSSRFVRRCCLAAVVGLAGCSPNVSPGHEPPSILPPVVTGALPPVVTVVVGFGMLKEIVDQVTDGSVNVVSLAGTGVEAHDLELSPDQVKAVQSADLVLYLGAGFQPSAEEAVTQRTGPVLDLSTTFNRPVGGEVDPHFWLDPVLLKQTSQAVAQMLDAEGIPVAGLNKWESELDALNDEFVTGLQDCQRKDVIVAHSAFGFLTARYGLSQHGVLGVGADIEPSAGRVRELAAFIAETGATTVFGEEFGSSRVADTLAAEAGVATMLLSSVETFTEEDLQTGEGYASKMRSNLESLQLGLDCVQAGMGSDE